MTTVTTNHTADTVAAIATAIDTAITDKAATARRIEFFVTNENGVVKFNAFVTV